MNIDRQEILNEYQIMDTMPEEEYDNVTFLASQILGSPIAFISLIDNTRQWLKSGYGVPQGENPRELTFCNHTITKPEGHMVVENATEDERFKDNPFVVNAPNVGFYAGVALVDSENYALGTLCVIDMKPGVMNEKELKTLKTLANHVVSLLELRKKNKQLEDAKKLLVEKNKNLSSFAQVASHDIKSPLNNICLLSESLVNGYGDGLGDDGKEILEYLKKSSNKLKSLVDGILKHSRGEEIVEHEKANLMLNDVLDEVVDIVQFEKPYVLQKPDETIKITINRVAFEQILINLITNAVKYNDKEECILDFSWEETETHLVFSLKDNGPGIPKEKQESIFEIFTTLGQNDSFGYPGNGIGLATVKKLVELQGGEISVSSILGQETTFTFSLLK